MLPRLPLIQNLGHTTRVAEFAELFTEMLVSQVLTLKYSLVLRTKSAKLRFGGEGVGARGTTSHP